MDLKYLFTDIYVGWPGKVHNVRVFRSSNIYTKGCLGTLCPPRPRQINGTDVPLVILGDPAYPLLPWLMKPLPDNGRLNDGQKHLTTGRAGQGWSLKMLLGDLRDAGGCC